MEEIKKARFTFESIADPSIWSKLLNSFSSYDFVHTQDFHNISHMNGEGEPILFSVKSSFGGCIVLWPALKRAIPGTTSFDLGCVYGYGGPVVSHGLTSSECVDAFECIFDGMAREGFVSMFSRMHPLFTNRLPGNLKGDLLGDVVVIDVKKNTQNILMDYRVSHRYEINRSIKKGVEAFVDYDGLYLNDFVDIYQEAMLDLSASDYYLFNSSYFNCLQNAKEFKAFTIFATYDGKKIAASIFIITKSIMHYYLSGTLPEFRKFSASKVIIAKAHEVAIELGVTEIVLGGGVGSKVDALLEFKKGFSGRAEEFHIFKKILNPQAYMEICKTKSVSSEKADFFPAYRSPNAVMSKPPSLK